MLLSSHPRTYFWLALKLHFSLLGSLGSQALSALWIPYIRDIPDQSGSWALGNKWWVFFSVWFREEADYYQSLNSSHISLPSRTGSCRSLPFREPWGQDYYRHHPSFHLFLSGDLSSSTDWTNTPTRILVPLREHGWGDSTSRTIVFSQEHLTHRGEITWSHPLSSGVTESPFLTCWTLSLPESTLSTSWGLENLLSVEGLLTGWENKLSSQNPKLSPGGFVWRTLVLSGDLFFSWPVSPGA